jgi:hypothetical protein
MDQLESYLDSVRKSLDVRSDAERDAIIAEMRDHLLESIEHFKAGGLEHELAVEKALQSIGDNRMVATSISEAHDGASWRQAWLAVLPIGILVLTVLGHLLFRRYDILVFAGVAILILGYAVLSRREHGRMWRVTWLATIASLAIAILTLPLMAWLLRTQGPQAAALWGITLRVGFQVLGLTALLVWRRQWLSAILLLVAFQFLAMPVSMKLAGNAVAVSVFSSIVWMAFGYLLFVKEWRGDWVMAWLFMLTFGFGAQWTTWIVSRYPVAQAVLSLAMCAIVLSCIVVASIVAPKRLTLPIFLTGAVLYGAHIAPMVGYAGAFIAPYFAVTAVRIINLLVFWGVVRLLQRRQLNNSLVAP